LAESLLRLSSDGSMITHISDECTFFFSVTHVKYVWMSLFCRCKFSGQRVYGRRVESPLKSNLTLRLNVPHAVHNKFVHRLTSDAIGCSTVSSYLYASRWRLPNSKYHSNSCRLGVRTRLLCVYSIYNSLTVLHALFGIHSRAFADDSPSLDALMIIKQTSQSKHQGRFSRDARGHF
jgi:hypothetical protein